MSASVVFLVLSSLMLKERPVIILSLVQLDKSDSSTFIIRKSHMLQ